MRAGANTSNAHVRQRAGVRQSPDVQAEEAHRLLHDPAFQRAFKSVHEDVVNAIITLQGANADQADDYERECCRTLRNLHAIKRKITLSVQGQQLRSVNKKPEI